MSRIDFETQRAEPVPLPDNITSVQPGGGFCYSLERTWGCGRRWFLKKFRPGYVQRMAELRDGSEEGAPHPVLDRRDLKYVRNLCTCDWDDRHDRFRWRERIPLARWGLGETVIMGTPLLALTVLPALVWPHFWYVGVVPLILLLGVLYFFRDPPRQVPQGDGILVSPADGKVAEITRLEHEDFIGGPAVRIGVFLSVFNVHINRTPSAARVIELRYFPGLFLNALDPQSALKNENMWVGLEEEAVPHRRLIVRQIAGLIARRIVCELRPGDTLKAGHKFGMIKLGSRTELIVPDDANLKVDVQVGEKIQAGTTIVARYRKSSNSPPTTDS